MKPFPNVKNTVTYMMTTISYIMIGRDTSLCIRYQCDDIRYNTPFRNYGVHLEVGQTFTLKLWKSKKIMPYFAKTKP